MNKFDLALKLIRPTPASKLQDRAWIFPVLLAGAVMYGGFTGRMSFDTAVMYATGLIGLVSGVEKVKDAMLGSAALSSTGIPDTINASGNVTVGANAPESAQSTSSSESPDSSLLDEMGLGESSPDELQRRAVMEQEAEVGNS